MREIQSLARGLHIVDMMVNLDRPMSVTELAEALDVDKSTASRLVGTLQSHGFVQQDHATRAYIPGKRLHSIGWQLTNRYALRETARPYLDALAEQTGECAHIGVYSSGKAIVTDDVQSSDSLLRVVGNTGRHIYLHNTAVGKALLAFGDFPLPATLPEVTPRTLTDISQLRENLSLIRETGFALDDEENEFGVRCIASPVFNSVGTTIAAIGISGPSVRVVDERMQALAGFVRDAAHQLSCELGYRPATHE